jgi:hypothetical protein
MTIRKPPGSPYNQNRWTRGSTRKAVLERDGRMCVLCRQEGVINMGTDGQGGGLVLAHITPERMGSGSEPEDLLLVCRRHSGEMDGGRRYR